MIFKEKNYIIILQEKYKYECAQWISVIEINFIQIKLCLHFLSSSKQLIHLKVNMVANIIPLIHFLMVLDKRVSLLFFFLLNLELYICISSNGRTIECRMKSIGGGILRYDGLMSLFRCLLRIWFASPIVSFCNICMLNNC